MFPGQLGFILLRGVLCRSVVRDLCANQFALGDTSRSLGSLLGCSQGVRAPEPAVDGTGWESAALRVKRVIQSLLGAGEQVAVTIKGEAHPGMASPSGELLGVGTGGG
jgi:hypothetical protein